MAPPKGLKATLRHYQEDGFAWLQFLSRIGLSGVLADDMGLGKTLQTLAHILAEKQAGRLIKPVPDRRPTSLFPTWRNEARKFAPDLRSWSCTATSGATVRRASTSTTSCSPATRCCCATQDLLLEHKYRMVVLDEAQAIKNPSTKLARTAFQLSRRASRGAYRHAHGEPSGRALVGVQLPAAGLPRRPRDLPPRVPQPDREGGRRGPPGSCSPAASGPFLLRRTKEQVASELPPKKEVLREIELTEAQRDLYESVRLAMHKRVREEIEQRGLARSNIAILEALLKLRQVCCDPRLLKSERPRRRAQRQVRAARWRCCRAWSRPAGSVIVFSQFVEMLELIEAGLVEQGIRVRQAHRPDRDRETPVNHFQDGEVPVFLISLKAGGTGITLTRADTVIHYDPWWNPAVEDQATDRAHRIGQDKTVFVYKLIAEGTVEEKMVELQSKKQALVDSVLSGTGAGLSFTEADIEALFAPLPELDS